MKEPFGACERQGSSEWGVGKDTKYRMQDARWTKDEGRGTVNQLSVTPQSAIPNPNSSLVTRYSSLQLGLLGDHQIKNAGLALAVIQLLQKEYPVSEEKVREGLIQVTWPGRMEVLSERPWIVLDGAHNPGAMRTLAETLPKVFSYKKLLLVFGMMKDKNIKQTLSYLIPYANKIFLTRAEYDRSADPEYLNRLIQGKRPRPLVFPTIPLAIKQAMKEAGPEDLILITGSLFVVGEARAWWMGKGSRCEVKG